MNEKANSLLAPIKQRSNGNLKKKTPNCTIYEKSSSLSLPTENNTRPSCPCAPVACAELQYMHVCACAAYGRERYAITPFPTTTYTLDYRNVTDMCAFLIV